MRTLQIIFCISLTLLFAATAAAKIVFKGPGRDANIYVMDDGGENIKRITDDTTSDQEPRWSPNGRQIRFCTGHRSA